MAKSTLENLQAQKALAQEQLTAAQRKLKMLARKQRALALKATLQRRQEIGALVEELGLPMDPDTLRPLLQLVARDLVPLGASRDEAPPADAAIHGDLRSGGKNGVLR
jgi:hypothetical protein